MKFLAEEWHHVVESKSKHHTHIYMYIYMNIYNIYPLGILCQSKSYPNGKMLGCRTACPCLSYGTDKARQTWRAESEPWDKYIDLIDLKGNSNDIYLFISYENKLWRSWKSIIDWPLRLTKQQCENFPWDSLFMASCERSNLKSCMSWFLFTVRDSFFFLCTIMSK